MEYSDTATSTRDRVPSDRTRGGAVSASEPWAQPGVADVPVEPDDSSPEAATSPPEAGTSEPLIAMEATVDFRRLWEEVQARFVDEPRSAVEEADRLVASVMEHLAERFAQERDHLEAQWGRGDDISTEELRVALQRYRSFFHRLLAS